MNVISNGFHHMVATMTWLTLRNICCTNDHGYVALVVTFPGPFMTITGFVTRVIRRVSLVEQVMNTLPEHISPPVFDEVHIVDLFCVMFCRSLFV
jgi:hypothetical protein